LKEQTRIVENIHEGLYEPFLEIFSKGQWAQSSLKVSVRKGWLKQLKVAISTRAGMPSGLLTDKRRIHLRSANVRTYTFFTTGFPKFLSIRAARGLQAFDLTLLTSYSNLNYY
jgi:hypothetical protein